MSPATLLLLVDVEHEGLRRDEELTTAFGDEFFGALVELPRCVNRTNKNVELDDVRVLRRCAKAPAQPRVVSA